MSQSPWNLIEADMRKSIVGPGNRSTLNGYNTLVKKHVYMGPPETIPHAILGTQKQVLMIRSYPRSTTSNCVVPITEDTGPCAVGWIWDGKTFQPKEPSND